MKTISLFILSASILSAAPSVDLGDELQIPLEQSSGFVLVHKKSGQLRLVLDDGSGSYSSTSYQTGLEQVTGGTSGFQEGGNEVVLLASASSNRLVRFNVGTLKSLPLFAEAAAPQFPVSFRVGAGDPLLVGIGNTMNNPKEALDFYENPTQAFQMIERCQQDITVGSLQPYYTTKAGLRYIAGVTASGGSERIFTDVDHSMTGVDLGGQVPAGMKLVTNVKRQDGTWMIIGYMVGDSHLVLMPMSSPPDLDAPTEGFFGRIKSYKLGDVKSAVASVAPASEDGSRTGVFVTYADHSGGAYVDFNADGTLIFRDDFKAPQGKGVNGMIAIPGTGEMMMLTGGSTKWSDSFSNWRWNTKSSTWEQQGTGKLSAEADIQEQFATLFWFDKEPMVNLNAKLLKYEVQPDWTGKSTNDPIPAKVVMEHYVSESSGLGSPLLQAPTVPAGSQFLMTNQVMDSVSLSALDSTLALMIPPLSVIPESGTYSRPVDFVAQTDDDVFRVYYRIDQPDGYSSWMNYSGPVHIAYPTTVRFFARNEAGTASSPIITRVVQMPVQELKSMDSDADGVPDFVEIAKGLDPFGGADSDGDGVTDLDELLSGTDPKNPNDKPASPLTPFDGEGFALLVQAQNTSGGVASDGEVADPNDGEMVEMYGMVSNLLGSGVTTTLTSPSSLSGQLAAEVDTKSAVPLNEWVVLHSPRYFDLNGSAPEVRGGREIYRVVQCPDQKPPEINPSLSGTDIDSDATAWISAAQAAYASYERVTTLTTLKPKDTVVAVLAEAGLYDALQTLSAADQLALGVPASFREFTLFGDRDDDVSRTAFSQDMRDALVTSGLSFERLLSNIQTQVDAVSFVDIALLVNDLYDFHVAHSEPTAVSGDLIPMLPLPLDVLRELARGGHLPSDYDGATTPARIESAKAKMATILGSLPSVSYRPYTTWVVRVSAPTVAGELYDYVNESNGKRVSFFEADGDRHSLNQGLGLAVGTLFEVSGYTDVDGWDGADGMELVSLRLSFAPLASDNDTNANLLADDWETFFFGKKGAVDPFAKHPVNGYSYLQLYLMGADPRSDVMPTDPPVVLFPGKTNVKKEAGGGLALTFKFPDAYVDRFDFMVQESDSLGMVTAFNDLLSPSTVTKVGENAYQINLPPASATGSKNFFRLYLRLKND